MAKSVLLMCESVPTLSYYDSACNVTDFVTDKAVYVLRSIFDFVLFGPTGKRLNSFGILFGKNGAT